MSVAGRVFSRLPVAGVVLGTCVLAAASAAYWFYVSQQRQYIVGRDFRILSTLARQVEATIKSEIRILENLADDKAAQDDYAPEAMAKRWFQLRGRPYQASDIEFIRTPWGEGKAHPKTNVDGDGEFKLEVTLQPRNRGTNSLRGLLKLQPALEPLFASKVGKGSFDAIVLGTSDGVVLVGAGPTAHQIRSSGLGVLSTKVADDGKPAGFSDLAKSIRMAEMSLAGVDYTSFVSPCCVSGVKDAPLILVGLVQAETIRSSSWAISTTLVKLAMLFLVIAVVAWPFLKLVLLGERQQVRVADFFQLGASTVAGLAIITMVLLDVSAYRRLNADIDAQLEALAISLDRNATAEVESAAKQLECVDRNFDKFVKYLNEDRLSSIPALANAMRGDNSLAVTYPFFETVAFIDGEGKQQVKLGVSERVSNRIPVGDRDYFKTIQRGRGWKREGFCEQQKCALESVWSWTTGEPLAVIAKESDHKLTTEDGTIALRVAAISIPMRSLIGPVLPPGFSFAVIDQSGEVLFHSDRQRNRNENLFVETDNNRRLRAQVAAHSAEPLNIHYWGSQYRAYLKPMALPGMYVVAMAQKERAWAINREWLVVAMIFLAVYLILWLAASLLTLSFNASWVWPDAARRGRYVAVSRWCGSLVVCAALIVASLGDPQILVVIGIALPLLGWLGTYLWLKRRPPLGTGTQEEPLVAYSIAAVSVLLVIGVVPGALLFLASYQMHARSYIQNSQLTISRMLSERHNRLNEKYGPTTSINPPSDRDIYFDFLYNTTIDTTGPHKPSQIDACGPEGPVLSLIEDYLPYYSEASVEWRELLHKCAGDRSWWSSPGTAGGPGQSLVFASAAGPTLTSFVPSMTQAWTVPASDGTTQPGTAQRGSALEATSSPDSWALLSFWGILMLGLTAAVVVVFNRRIYLVGITEPLWACGQMVVNVGENVLVLCDGANKARQLEGVTPLRLEPIVRDRQFTGAWQRALTELDARAGDRPVLIDDFDERLDDAHAMDRKLTLLEELVSDQSRTVIVLSQVSLRALTDSLGHSARVMSSARVRRAANQKTTPTETPIERWRRVLKAFVVVERREQESENRGECEKLPAGPVVAFLMSEGRSHPYVKRVCDDLLNSDAVKKGRMTRRQAFDEVAERTTQFYRSLWASCCEDEKVVLGHVAQHGLANSSVRSVVRRLLGRRLLVKTPALRLMNETFRRFVLNRECSQQVVALESERGLSPWDRLRAPLGFVVVVISVFLFATQKELYNAIFGFTTAAAASVPTLFRAVVTLVSASRLSEGQASKAA